MFFCSLQSPPDSVTSYQITHSHYFLAHKPWCEVWNTPDAWTLLNSYNRFLTKKGLKKAYTYLDELPVTKTFISRKKAAIILDK